MSAATVPEPPEPLERTYKVVGVQAILGHAPGSQFTATLAPEQEAFFLEIGALKVDDDESSALRGLSREELDARAEEVGVENADRLPNKSAVITAITEKTKE